MTDFEAMTDKTLLCKHCNEMPKLIRTYRGDEPYPRYSLQCKSSWSIHTKLYRCIDDAIEAWNDMQK